MFAEISAGLSALKTAKEFAGIACALMSVLVISGCDLDKSQVVEDDQLVEEDDQLVEEDDEPSITISGLPKKGEQIIAEVSGKTYGDITWLWSMDQDYLETYILSSGPTKVILVPSVVSGTGVPISSTGTYIRARVDKTGTGDYVYSNGIGPIS